MYAHMYLLVLDQQPMNFINIFLSTALVTSGSERVRVYARQRGSVHVCVCVCVCVSEYVSIHIYVSFLIILLTECIMWAVVISESVCV